MSKIYDIENHSITLENGDVYNVNTYTTYNKNGFTHHAVANDAFFRNENLRVKAHYMNRTWESYKYQSVLKELQIKIERIIK